MSTKRYQSTFPPPRNGLSPHFEHRGRRVLFGATTTVLLVLVLILNPDAATVYATNMFGALRAPGEPAFVAAHRGDRADAPENTLPAMKLALDSDVSYLEMDIHLTSDGVPVLIHDDWVDRTTNGSGLVSSMTLAQIKHLDAGSWFNSKFRGTRVPTLDEFLGLFADSRKKALLELKGVWTPDQARVVAELIYSHGVQNRVVFMSFVGESLRNLESVAPFFPRVIISHTVPSHPAEFVKDYGAIALLTSAQAVQAHRSTVSAMHKAGLGLIVYTLNSPSRWSKALKLGVDGIVTDQPSSLDRWFAITAPGT
jgi:glycerophosphoryl diester phosphodiesterase